MALKYPFYRLRGSENFHFPLVYKMKTISLFEKNQLNLVFVCKYLLNECIPALNGHIIRYLEKIIIANKVVKCHFTLEFDIPVKMGKRFLGYLVGKKNRSENWI